MNKLAKFSDAGTSLSQMSYHHMLMLLLNAVGIGLILVITTFLEMKYLSGYEAQFTPDADDDDDDGGRLSCKSESRKARAKTIRCKCFWEPPTCSFYAWA